MTMTIYLFIICVLLVLGIPLTVYLELRRRNSTKTAAKKAALQLGLHFEDAAHSFCRASQPQNQPEAEIARTVKKARKRVFSEPLASVIYMATPWKILGDFEGQQCTAEFCYLTDTGGNSSQIKFSTTHFCDLPEFLLCKRGKETTHSLNSSASSISLPDQDKLICLTTDEKHLISWLEQSERSQTFARLIQEVPSLSLSNDKLSFSISSDNFEMNEESLRKTLMKITSFSRSLDLVVDQP